MSLIKCLQSDGDGHVCSSIGLCGDYCSLPIGQCTDQQEINDFLDQNIPKISDILVDCVQSDEYRKVTCTDHICCELKMKHVYDCVYGNPLLYMQGTERYECSICGKRIYL